MNAKHWSDELLSPMRESAGTRVVFALHGEVDHAVKERLVADAESYSIESADAVILRKRLFNVLVEGLDNLSHHTEAHHRASCFATLLDTGVAYRLFFGNTVQRSVAEMLMHRIAVLTEMSEVDLKEHFLKLLSNDGRTDRGGAGLGLVTMARKSGKAIRAHQLPVDDQFVRLVVELTIRRD